MIPSIAFRPPPLALGWMGSQRQQKSLQRISQNSNILLGPLDQHSAHLPQHWIRWGSVDNKRVCCEAALTQAFPFEILKTNLRRKNSITLGKNSRFLQLLMYCFQNSYILITFAIILACFCQLKIILCQNSGFFKLSTKLY